MKLKQVAQNYQDNDNISHNVQYRAFNEGVKWIVSKAFFAGVKSTSEGFNGEYANGNDPDVEVVFNEKYQEFLKTL